MTASKTSLKLAARPSHSYAVHALVVGLQAAGETPAVVTSGELPQPTIEHLQRAVATLHLTGSAGQVVRLVGVPGVKAASVVLTGLGGDDGVGTGPGDGTGVEAGHEAVRRAAGAALRLLVGTAGSVVVDLPCPSPAALGAVAEGAYAGCYRYERRATGPGIATVTVASGCGRRADARGAVARAEVLGRRRALVRDLVNTPANLLTPATFVTRVRQESRSASAGLTGGKLAVTVLDERALARLHCGGILGVGQGSANPPRIVELAWRPATARASVALVGKGVTFDSGGLRIKPIDSMVVEKADMAGAATVMGAVLAAADLAIPVAVTAWLCLAENMIDGNCQRPGDVVTMHNGMTVEILDPDAEGRMCLADGMALACERRPDALVDIATLTGMQVTALGRRIAGLMGTDEGLRDRVLDAAQRSGEPMWVMPLPHDERPSLDTPMADIAHKAEAQGGMLSAGLFLAEFVAEGTAWAHIDMAGPGYNPKAAYGHTGTGATGFGLATLLRLIESYAA